MSIRHALLALALLASSACRSLAAVETPQTAPPLVPTAEISEPAPSEPPSPSRLDRTPDPEHRATEAAQQSENQGEPPQPATPVGAPPPQPEPEDTPEYVCCEAPSERWDAPGNLINTAIAVIAFLALFVQGVLTRRSLRQSRKAAKAAKRSNVTARAAVEQTQRLERAWVIAAADQHHLRRAFGGGLHLLPSERQGKTTFSVSGEVAVETLNYGRSPAWIERGAIDFKVLPFPLPEEPPYTMQECGGVPLPPESRGDGPREIEVTVSSVDRGEVMAGRKCVALFGCTVYRDVFDEIRETRYCWVWRRGEDERGNPMIIRGRAGGPNWNRTT